MKFVIRSAPTEIDMAPWRWEFASDDSVLFRSYRWLDSIADARADIARVKKAARGLRFAKVEEA
jgi:hypothetical protein